MDEFFSFFKENIFNGIHCFEIAIFREPIKENSLILTPFGRVKISC